MKITPLFSVALAGSLLFTACSKEKSTGQDTNPNVTYQLATTTELRGATNETGRSAASVLALTGGTASVTQIKFEAKGDNKVEYKSDVNQVINLSDAAATLGALAIPYGTYNKVEFRIRFAPTANHPALQLTGTYTPSNGSAAIPVVVQFSQPFELKFEKKTPTVIDANTDYAALGTLALNTLVAVVPEAILSTATQTNGQIIISSASNTNLYHPLWKVFENMLKVEIKKR
jgi:hypothetical protein